MSLESYRRKRDFKATAEPEGVEGTSEGGNSFVIQKHAARRLHYDLRLEMDGVLKSWAVTRGPSLVPGDKRLAVHVEDHPLDYGDFEGTIPKGEYGGGTVIVWDRGTWSPIGDAHKGYAKGHLDFELHGQKLGGRWHLVRLARKPNEKRENWLLIKGDDEAARPEDAPDILEERPESVKTGRVVEQVAGEAPGWSSETGRIEREDPPEPQPSLPAAAQIRKARKAELPSFIEPTLATLATRAPAGKSWLHEIKFDGYRLQARIDRGRVKLLTRGGLDWTDKFGKAVVGALKALPVETAMLDGELIVENEAGASDFSALQADLSAGRSDRFVYYAFDLLHLDGYDLQATPLAARKEALQQLIGPERGLVRFSEHFEQDGDLVLRHACRLSLEGVISKRRDGPYRSGRGKDWLKSKCSERQEFVIGGYVLSTTSRKAIGSLVLGYYVDGRLIHAGRVGTGYTAAVAEDLYRRLERIRAPSPFAERLTGDAGRQVRYVRPELVAEVEFRGWTADRNLRHASFRGLREDKAATEVTREDAAPPVAEAKPAVKLTHPDRVYWPDAGVTKEGLADYYAEVWRFMAPFVVNRPLSLVRCPNGVTGECFYQKHAWQGLSRYIRPVHDPKDPSDEPILVIEDFSGLIGLVQGGVLEIHPWGSTMDRLEQPDMIIMDLDPDEAVSWPEVIKAAHDVRERLAAHGLASFIKTTGGKGLHVVSPVQPRAEWDAVKAFTKRIAESMTADSPERFVATVTKAKRRGKILVDYLRNGRGATAVGPYSTRSRRGAPVSMPISWDEAENGIGPSYFNVMNTPTRLRGLSQDPWAGFREAAAPIPESAPKRRRAA
jgi:bifunctional non-homologous end joining protein LigD